MKRQKQRPEKFDNFKEYSIVLELEKEPDYRIHNAIAKYHSSLLVRLNKLITQQLKTTTSNNKNAKSENYDKSIAKVRVQISLLGYQYPEYLI